MLDKSLTEFLERGLAIHIGTRNAALRPNGCRVTAVRVEDQGRHLVAYLPKAATPAVLEDLRSNGQAAVSFARPTDDRAVQVKGEFISVRDADPSEEAFVLGQWQALLARARHDWPRRADLDQHLADVAVRRRQDPRDRGLQPDAGT